MFMRMDVIYLKRYFEIYNFFVGFCMLLIYECWIVMYEFILICFYVIMNCLIFKNLYILICWYRNVFICSIENIVFLI